MVRHFGSSCNIDKHFLLPTYYIPLPVHGGNRTIGWAWDISNLIIPAVYIVLLLLIVAAVIILSGKK